MVPNASTTIALLAGRFMCFLLIFGPVRAIAQAMGKLGFYDTLALSHNTAGCGCIIWMAGRTIG
jgi:hypothetical protein